MKLSPARLFVILILALCGYSLSFAQNNDAEPKYGGTLKLVGSSDVGSFDPVSARGAALFLHRALTRNLVSFPTSSDLAIAAKPVADLAEMVPEPEEGGLVYRFTIREGANWSTNPPRQITAQDAIHGFKRLCNPVEPTGAPSYYIGVIEGFAEFCEAFATVPATVEAIRDYMETHSVPGLVAEDDRTLTIRLEQPTGDFMSILALLPSAPVAVEMMDYLPNSPDFRRNYISSGPYAVDEYLLGTELSLKRNPGWDEAADPMRKAYVDRIEVAFGTGDAGKTQRMIETGEIDIYFDLSVATSDLSRLMQNPDDPQLLQFSDGAVNPALVINIRSPNNNGALADLRVRQAISYAVNKVAVAQVGGGPDIKQPIHQILTSLVDGHVPFNLYPSEGDQGDVEKAKELLAEAGFPNGIDLKFSYSAGGRYELYAAALEADLAKAGIRLQMQPAPSRTVQTQMYQNREAVEAGAWDLGMTSLSPSWIGNAARTMIVPMFYGRTCEASTTNWTCYQNPEVDALIDQALATIDPDEAVELWSQVDRLILEDAPVVPMITGKITLYSSERLRGTEINLLFNNVDPGLVWLAN